MGPAGTLGLAIFSIFLYRRHPAIFFGALARQGKLDQALTQWTESAEDRSCQSKRPGQCQQGKGDIKERRPEK